MALTNSNSPVIPTLDEIMQAHRTLGDLLGLHHKAMTGEEKQEGGLQNKLMPMMPKQSEQMPAQPKRY